MIISKMNEAQRYQLGRRVTLVGAVINIFLAVGKMIVGYLGNSYGLIADGIHSFSDLLTDILVLFASHYGSQEADHNHPYGHRRIETAATVGLALVLLLIALSICWNALQHLLLEEFQQVSQLTVWVAAISIGIKEWLYHYTQRVGKMIESDLVIANAWHHRSDAATSVVVLVGLIGNLLGFAYLDALMALVIGIWLIKLSWDLGWGSLSELVDTGVDQYTLEKIQRTIQGVTGVRTLHQLRNRSMGGKLFIDVHILVDPDISVSEGHYIADRVYRRVRQEHPKVMDITIHVDPENDEKQAISRGLPARSELTVLLKQRWADVINWQELDKLHLHYLNGKVHIEVWQKWSSNERELDLNQLVERLAERLADKTYIAEVKLLVYSAKELS